MTLSEQTASIGGLLKTLYHMHSSSVIRIRNRREKSLALLLLDTLTRVVEAGRKEFTQIGGLQFSSIVPHIPNATEVKGIC